MRIARCTLTVAVFPFVAASIAQRRDGSLARQLMANRAHSKLAQRRQQTLSATPCDPSEPDVGILACGDGQYCSPSDSSVLGGLCIEASRSLQGVVELCGTPYAEQYNCDCTQFDNTTGTGTVSCLYYDNRCFDHQGQQVCLSVDISVNIDPSISRTSYSYCYIINGEGFPYNELCFRYLDVGDGLRECGLSVDGVACTNATCIVAEGSACEDSSLNNIGFDCENTNKGDSIPVCSTTDESASFPILVALVDSLTNGTGSVTPVVAPALEPSPSPVLFPDLPPTFAFPVANPEFTLPPFSATPAALPAPTPPTGSRLPDVSDMPSDVPSAEPSVKVALPSSVPSIVPVAPSAPETTATTSAPSLAEATSAAAVGTTGWTVVGLGAAWMLYSGL